MFSSLTSWLSGGSQTDKEGEGDVEKATSTADESKESVEQAQSEGEERGASWAGSTACSSSLVNGGVDLSQIFLQNC